MHTDCIGLHSLSEGDDGRIAFLHTGSQIFAQHHDYPVRTSNTLITVLNYR